MSLNRRVFYFYLSPVPFCTWSPGWTTPQTPRCTRARCIKRPLALVCCPQQVKTSLIIVWLNILTCHFIIIINIIIVIVNVIIFIINIIIIAIIIVIIIVSLLSSASSSSRRHRHSHHHHHHYRCHYHTNFSEDFLYLFIRLQTRDNLFYHYYFFFFNGAEDLLLLLNMIKLDTGKPCKATCCRAV